MTAAESLDRLPAVKALPEPIDQGPYRLLAVLGSGSFGTVYAARHFADRGEPVAVKVAWPALSDSPEFLARFREEIGLIRRVNSPFVPKLLDANPDGAPAWMATQLIPGLPLDVVIRNSVPMLDDALWHLGAGMLEALQAIHAAGVLHRDLRPRNVVLTSAGPWVVDFSLARSVEIAHRFSSYRPRSAYGYMSPEEANGGLMAAHEPADVYTFGATLVFAATGRPVFDESSAAGALEANPNLLGLGRGELREVLERCLRPDSEKRPPVAELQETFAGHVGSGIRDGFAAALRDDVAESLRHFRDGLARVLGGGGPAELGWGDARSHRGLPARAPAATTAMAAPPAPAPPAPLLMDGCVRWTRKVGAWVCGPVAVSGGNIAVTSLDGVVAVLRAADGSPAPGWREPVQVGAPLHAGPLLLGQSDATTRVFAGAADGWLHEIGLVSRWDRVVVQAGAGIEGPPVAAGEWVWAVSGDGRVYRVHAHAGENRVLYDMDAAATGALCATEDVVVSADADGWVHAISVPDGERKWREPIDGIVLCAPLPAGKVVYICATDGVVREFGLSDGRVRSQVALEAAVHVTPARAGSRLYVASCDGVVHALQTDTGGLSRPDPIWQAGQYEEITGLAASRGRVYVAAGHRLVELDVATGADRDLLSVGGLIGAPVIDAGDCYVASLDGSVSCVRLL
ncbi:MAG TPA: PQQ-binding-like beta-propeller repeat protein [Streptosporangiaceae bacterium]|nr:PQQ-binding-like beta-propeller repeat protein [Streptosporangiaceae bacterium]